MYVPGACRLNIGPKFNRSRLYVDDFNLASFNFIKLTVTFLLLFPLLLLLPSQLKRSINVTQTHPESGTSDGRLLIITCPGASGSARVVDFR